MRCNECGTEASIESVFCHKCGSRLEVDPTPAGQSDEPIGPQAAADPPASVEPIRSSPIEKLTKPLGGVKEYGEEDDEETTLWEGRYCAKAMVGQWIATALGSVGLLVAAAMFVRGGWWWVLLIVLAVLWAGLYLLFLYRKLSVRYRLTNHRFFHASGLIRRTADRIEVIDMDDITHVQGPIERMVGVGTIHITSSDRTHPLLELRGIADVNEVAEQLDKARRAERLKRGIHIESI